MSERKTIRPGSATEGKRGKGIVGRSARGSESSLSACGRVFLWCNNCRTGIHSFQFPSNYSTTTVETYTNASFNKILRQPPSLESPSQVSARPKPSPIRPRAIRPNSDDDHDHDHGDDEDEDDVRRTHLNLAPVPNARSESMTTGHRPPAKGGQYIRVAAGTPNVPFSLSLTLRNTDGLIPQPRTWLSEPRDSEAAEIQAPRVRPSHAPFKP